MLVSGVCCTNPVLLVCFFFFQAEDGIRDHAQSRGLGDVYKRQEEINKKKSQDFWNIFNEKRNYDNFDYELTYEIDQNVQVPIEIDELGKYIENKGYDMVRLFEMTGRQKEAQDLSLIHI
eukprot:TRINITY_DN7721_c0_g1_i3.p2 TRINITY_DN7721_c0_g1~~TRINITY_DN7721_c0_g1_i3.p2  ORF type:complete len:120 (-),score=30.80 TRINITY_DN7721_c0_g1_i3:159-518(-)